MFITSFGVMVSLTESHVKMYQVVHFKHVPFLVCQLYLNKAVLKKNSNSGYVTAKVKVMMGRIFP